MGCHDKIASDRFPRQGTYLGARCGVMFHFGGPEVEGVVVRDDNEDPWRTIIQLDDGRYVLATECQYRPLPGWETPS